MLPRWHILLGASFSLVLFFIFNVSFLNSLIVFLASFLIDIDHYIIYAFRKKDLSLRKACDWYKKLDDVYKRGVKKNPHLRCPLFIFHTVEFFVVAGLFSLYFNYFYILIGFLFHIIIDLADLIFSNLFNLKELSLINYFFSDKDNYL